MRSIRERISLSTSQASKRSSQASASTSSLPSSRTNTLHGSTSTVDTQAKSCDGDQTLPTSVSITPPVSIHVKNAVLTSEPTRVPPKANEDGEEEVLLRAYKALEVNVAMLDFAKRLPLDDLSMIGRGLGPHSPRKETVESEEVGEEAHPRVLLESFTESRSLSLASSSSSSSWSFACYSARRVERDDALREDPDGRNVPDDSIEPESDAGIVKKELTGSRTLNLTSASSDSSWSFACRSARRIEQDHTGKEEGTVFGDEPKDNSCTFQSTIVVHGFDHSQRNTFYRPIRCSLPDKQPMEPPCIADGETDTKSTLTGPTRHAKRTPSFTRRSIDSADVFLWSIGIRIPGAKFTRMSDEEFDKLPDWSDVEDDPEYDTVEKRSYCWSSTASSCSSKSLEDVCSGDDAPEPVVRRPMMGDEEFGALPDGSDVDDIESTTESSKSSEEMKSAVPPVVYVPTGYPRLSAATDTQANTIQVLFQKKQQQNTTNAPDT
jgi:hypothetical protein